MAFASAIFDAKAAPSSSTFLVLRATVAFQYAEVADHCAEVLIHALPDCPRKLVHLRRSMC